VGRILSLLAIVLVLANARCLVRCQLDSADRSAPPCHSQNHSQTKVTQDHCIEQHELSVAPAVQQIVVGTLVDTASNERLAASSPIREGIGASPPLFTAWTNPPLRI